MSESLVQTERDAGVATLTFHDPDRLNAMTRAMGEAFSHEIVRLSREPDLRAVVLTGAGRAFSAGGDFDMLEGLAAQGAREGRDAEREIRDTMRSFYGLFLASRDLACPTIAAINGHAIGAGLCVALACDLRIAAARAKLSVNFTKLAIHPGMGATWTLPRLVGTARAAELLFTSRQISGEEAAAMGLVSQALEADAVLPAAQALARDISACSPIAVAGVKQALRRSPNASLEDQLHFEASEQAICFQTEDIREGLAAGRERREPRFRGR